MSIDKVPRLAQFYLETIPFCLSPSLDILLALLLPPVHLVHPSMERLAFAIEEGLHQQPQVAHAEHGVIPRRKMRSLSRKRSPIMTSAMWWYHCESMTNCCADWSFVPEVSPAFRSMFRFPRSAFIRTAMYAAARWLWSCVQFINTFTYSALLCEAYPRLGVHFQPIRSPEWPRVAGAGRNALCTGMSTTGSLSTVLHHWNDVTGT